MNTIKDYVTIIMVNLNRYNGSYNTPDDPSCRICDTKKQNI